MGFSGNIEPQYIVPTACAKMESVGAKQQSTEGLADLDFYIGNEAISRSSTHTVDYPIRHGLIENWDDMERLWQRCFFDYLRCEPEVRNARRALLACSTISCCAAHTNIYNPPSTDIVC